VQTTAIPKNLQHNVRFSPQKKKIRILHHILANKRLLAAFLCRLFLVNGRPISYAREVSCRRLKFSLQKDLVGLPEEPRIQIRAFPMVNSLSRIPRHPLPILAMAVQRPQIPNFKQMIKISKGNHKARRKHTIYPRRIEPPTTGMHLHNQT
jgi:hypothetical protein